MAANSFRDIDFSNVPSEALRIYKNAFLNLPPRKQHGGIMRPSESEDRILCAQNFRAAINSYEKDGSKSTLHGKRLMVHQLVKEVLDNSSFLTSKQDPENDLNRVIEIQFNEILKDTPDLPKLLPMIDTSGSMYSANGIPIQAAVGLGILVALKNKGVLKHQYLSFNANPQLHTLYNALTDDEDNTTRKFSFVKAVVDCSKSDWGMNTNFLKALRIMSKMLLERGVDKEEIKKEYGLIVFSDMQIDEAKNPSDAKNVYRACRNELSKQGLPCPRLIFWNLRGDTNNSAANSDDPNCILISGFSQTMMKMFLNGDIDNLKPPTPADALLEMLQSDRYSKVRAEIMRVFNPS